MLTHTYPHEPWRKNQWSSARLTAYFTCGLISALVICQQRKGYVWFKCDLEVLRTLSSTQLGFEPMTSRSRMVHFMSHQEPQREYVIHDTECPCLQPKTSTFSCSIPNMKKQFHRNWYYRISLIRRLGVNQQIVCCVPGVKRSRGLNLNVEFCRRLERSTSIPPGVKKMSRGVYNV